MDSIRIGSEEHKRLFCRTFIETHDPFKPEAIVWPDIDAESLARLKSLPVWNEAARTEAATAVKVQALGRTEQDPVLAEAIALQGYEEARHSDVIQRLTSHYGIAVKPFPEAEVPKNPTWTFLRTGYGECMDSFFAFGLFSLGSKSGLFPAKVVAVFETIMQEEARHILFIVNWAAYLRAQRSLPLRPAFDARRAWNIVAQAVDRVRGAMQLGGGEGDTQYGFTLSSHTSFSDFSLRSFLELCLSENERRFAPYDPRLLRPILVPSAVKAILKVLPRGKSATPSSAAA
ncbi:MAG TPA: ferritin-like domain-containing protein [Thermoanaerobaculia bacterium]|nr:ferritin-like domain-containing protein [Thermoanaerobaculia bacterium]